MEIQTVLGPIEPSKLGVTLIHEHILCDFIGADEAGPHRYDADEVAEVMLPHLERLRQAGGQSLVDCSPKYLGRDVKLLKRLAEASGLNIITNTGLYKEPSLPKYALEGSADSTAGDWSREALEGMEGTGIRPGIIKIAVEEGPLSEVHEKIVRAAARAHLRTGLTIVAHTGNGEAGLHELEVLAEEGVAAEAFIWAHADNEANPRFRREAAARGAWIELDGIGMSEYDKQISMIHALLEAGFEKRLLVSQDAGWYTVGEPRGGTPRPYEKLLTEFLPALEKSGVPRATLDRLVIENPRRALLPAVRAR
jgi:phosphotriesterase-related protein